MELRAMSLLLLQSRALFEPAADLADLLRVLLIKGLTQSMAFMAKVRMVFLRAKDLVSDFLLRHQQPHHMS